MKTRNFLAFLAMCFAISFSACSEDAVAPEVSFTTFSSDVNIPEMVFTSEGETQALSFTSSSDWEITVSAPYGGVQWCRTEVSKGSAGQNNVNVIVDKNTGVDDRSVVLTIISGELRKRVIVTQKKQNTLILTQEKYEISEKGGTIDVLTKANVDCEAIIPEGFDWITQKSHKVSRGLVDNKFQFDIAPCKEYTAREGLIIFKGEERSDTVHVFQSGSSIILLTTKSYVVGPEGDVIDAEIKSNCDYEIIMPDVDWIKRYVGSRAVSSHQAKFVVEKNEGYDSREAIIIVKDVNTDNADTITVTQLQKDALFIGQDEYNLSASGEDIQIQLQTNTEYSVSIPSSCNWIHYTDSKKSRALREEVLTISVDENQIFTTRSQEIEISASSGLSKKIVIKQAAPMFVLNTKKINLMDGDCEKLNITLDSNISASDISWSSKDPSVASVSSEGVVTAQKKGTTEIVVQSKEGQQKSECTIIVNDILDYITIENNKLSSGSINGYCQGGWTVEVKNKYSKSAKIEIESDAFVILDEYFRSKLLRSPSGYSGTFDIPSNGSHKISVNMTLVSEGVTIGMPQWQLNTNLIYNDKKYPLVISPIGAFE